jgi:hypothetical protein
MFCDHCGVAVPAAAASCGNCGHQLLPDNPTPTAAVRGTGLPYGWGRFYAGLQIVLGFFLLVFMLVFWKQFYPSVRHMMMIGIAVALPLGFGLWKRARWALYLLTGVFVVEAGRLLSLHGNIRPILALVLHGIMLYYCWRRERDFV